ncbi:NADH dehydrogenase [ubiquinone] iron-sulfur protein 4, mitochondrial [Agrilus planipennis]|uniref:NADH dehydrogenase [ubiquinone] iron-sulfur protein 4, mitochondrial n=1 Tax=Agrilus planipennis TaxID=224129 RepID=A0A1W4XLA4_AGRPL|nr:NADH dehydrogenase [ubiquinone] iron-sulfur protein 4, mitochondrial [Agrilus planipennis]
MAHLKVLPQFLTNVNRWCCASFSTSTFRQITFDPTDIKSALATPEEIAHKKQLKNTVCVEGPVNLSPISGVPEEIVKERRVRIFEPAKNAMQSGTDNIGNWRIEFDNRERWENPLMGWCSSGDPHSNLHIQFSTKEEAITYCQKNGYKFYVEKSHLEKKFKPKSYAANFSWNKHTRVSTK